MKKIAETSRGDCMFVEPNGVGGNRYWSDSIGGGFVVWDTALASLEELILAMAAEQAARQADARTKALAVLNELDGRCGFDGVLDALDDELRSELEDALVRIIGG